MQLCVNCFDKLKLECKKHNLLQFMATDGAEILRRVSDLADKGVVTPENFDPVLAADLAIKQQFMVTTGEAYNGGCVLCAIDLECPSMSQNWIKGAVLDQLEIAKHIGVLPETGVIH